MKKTQEKNLSIFEKVKSSKHTRRNDSEIYTEYDSLYAELGSIMVNPDDPYNIYRKSDKKIAQMEKWINNWKQLKKETVQEILSQFTKEELQEALTKKLN